MDSAMTGFATGLADSLNKYLGSNIQAQQKEKEQEQSSNLELYRQSALETYKQTLAGKIDPQTAASVHPEASKLVTDFQSQNQRYPTVEEFDSLTKSLGKQGEEGPSKNEIHQDELEKEYANRLQKVVSFRSGGLGMTDQKVDQARQLRVLLNQYYDPEKDTYNVPPAQHSELAIGMARLLSGTGTVSTDMEKQLRQTTAKEGLAKGLIYAGMDPSSVGGPTTSVVKMFRDSIDRQGLEAEHQRDQYITGLKGLAPGNLDQPRVDRLNKAQLTSSYKDILSQSPDKQQTNKHPIGKVRVKSPDGKSGFIPASQLGDALKAGYSQVQ